MQLKHALWAAAAGISTTVVAHPGHGVSDGTTLVHHLCEPMHVLGYLAVAATVATTCYWRQQRAD